MGENELNNIRVPDESSVSARIIVLLGALRFQVWQFPPLPVQAPFIPKVRESTAIE